ncbi:MAG: ribonuclease Z [Bacteroidales bacterium]
MREGTQVSLRRMHIHFQRIKHIFISHLHGDHFYGLIGLVSSMHSKAHKPLHIYGPPTLKEILEMQLLASRKTTLLRRNFTLPRPKRLMHAKIKQITVSSFPLLHRIPTTGPFQEKTYERKLRKDMLEQLKIPVHLIPRLRAGEDYTAADGTVYPNEAITMQSPAPRTYAFCSDTAYYEQIIPVIEGASLLYHETTFMNDREANAADKFHATTGQAATIAAKAV